MERYSVRIRGIVGNPVLEATALAAYAEARARGYRAELVRQAHPGAEWEAVPARPLLVRDTRPLSSRGRGADGRFASLGREG